VKPPLRERFLTANIKELRFVSLTNYYAPIETHNLTSDISKVGLKTFKDNCIFCHSINNVGGNKGGSLVDKYALILDREKQRFTEAFLKKHGIDNEEKQNTKQFLTNNSLDAVLKFLQGLKVE
jgi:mono/diheme cytochrome c family protein